MAAVKKKKPLMYKEKPLYRFGDRIYYGNLEDKYILVLDIKEKKEINGIEQATRVKIRIMDNQGALGEGQTFRSAEKSNLYKALDIGAWWLQEAITFG